jgi:hypothetical protein
VGSALVVGDRGSGLTTFVGLLYAAQLRLGTEEGDEFRFSADRESIRQLEGIYGELVAGRFPEWDADWDTHPLSFVFGFRSGTFPRLRGGAVRHDGGFDSFRVQVGGISVESVAELAEHDAILEDSTRQLLRSPVVLPLVDASRLLPLTEDAERRPLERYDRMLAATLDLLSRFLSASRHRRHRTLYPMFVVTKFDQCPRETLDRFLIPGGTPASWPAGTREAVGENILTSYLPETLRLFQTTKRRGEGHVALPRWFYSSLEVVPGPEGLRIARRSRIPVGAWEPEYPFEEYRTLIHELATLAHRLPSWEESS